MVEAGGGGPGWESFAAKVAETLLEAGEVGAGLRVARWDGTAGARVAALELDFADAGAHHAALVFSVELILPKRWQVPVRARGFRGNVGAIAFDCGPNPLAGAGVRPVGTRAAHC